MISETASRRSFLQLAASALAGTALSQDIIAQTSASATGIPARPLGRTGVRVSIIGIGGSHAGRIPETENSRFTHMAIDEGVTFFDNAWDYGGGAAEEIMGKSLAMDGYRKKAFLMTKNCGRDYKDSVKCLEDSLRRLRTDYLDLWQFHEINYDNDPDWVVERGALKAAIEARKAGKVRFIGFTGHKHPSIHLEMLGKNFEWDASQMPINVADEHFRSFRKQVVPVCLKKNVGVLGMKGMGGRNGILLGNEGLTAEECLRYCLSQPVATQIVGMTSIEQLKNNIAVARNFQPLKKEEHDRLATRVKPIASDGRFELFKSQNDFDADIHRVQHGMTPRGNPNAIPKIGG